MQHCYSTRLAPILQNKLHFFVAPFHITFKENFTIIHDSLDLYRFLNITTMSFNCKTTSNIVYIPG